MDPIAIFFFVDHPITVLLILRILKIPTACSPTRYIPSLIIFHQSLNRSMRNSWRPATLVLKIPRIQEMIYFDENQKRLDFMLIKFVKIKTTIY